MAKKKEALRRPQKHPGAKGVGTFWILLVAVLLAVASLFGGVYVQSSFDGRVAEFMQQDIPNRNLPVVNTQPAGGNFN